MKKSISKSEFMELSRCKRWFDLNEAIKTNSLTLDLKEVRDDLLTILERYYQHAKYLAYKNMVELFGEIGISESKPCSCQYKANKLYFQADLFMEIKGERFNLVKLTSKTDLDYLNLGFSNKQVSVKLFEKVGDELRLRNELPDFSYDDVCTEDKFLSCKQTLLDRYTDTGNAIYEMAFERFVYENELKQGNKEELINRTNYYLVVLNSRYTLDSTNISEGKPTYQRDSNGNNLFTLIDVNLLTQELLPKIEADLNRIMNYNTHTDETIYIGRQCEFKKDHKCQFVDFCFTDVPKENSLFAYMDYSKGFVDDDKRYFVYDLFKDGMKSMTDVPRKWLNRKNNVIQFDCVQNNVVHIFKEKIKKALELVDYPRYYIDFETFPCPYPRFIGEGPYTQSVFQVSIHTELSKDQCDKDENHVEYVASDHKDHRLEIVKTLMNTIQTDKGGKIIVYNKSFEKMVLENLAETFPEYAEALNKMIDMLFDLMDLVMTNKSLYKSLGFNDEESGTVNYYHKDLNGSYSIKKVLPLFSKLNYHSLDVKNGVEAIKVYSELEKLDEEVRKSTIEALKEYCKQDTWAMVEILKGLEVLVS